MADPIAMLNRPDWTWYRNGVQIETTNSRGQLVRVNVPIERIEIIFNREMARVGCPLGASVGGPPSVGGFFKKVSRGVKKLGRKVAPKVVRKAVSKVAKVAKKIGKTVVKVGRSPWFRAALGAAATAFPVLAPVAAGVEVANRVADQIERGKQAADRIVKGARDAATIAEAIDGKEKRDGVATMMKLAQKGDHRAQRFMGAWVEANKGAMVPAKPVKKAAVRRVARGVQRARRANPFLPKSARAGARRPFAVSAPLPEYPRARYV